MSEKKLFSIGDVARLFHISVSSLRHYENVGLLAPEYTDPSSGYRYYSVEQFEILNTIRYLRPHPLPLPRQPYGSRRLVPQTFSVHCGA